MSQHGVRFDRISREDLFRVHRDLQKDLAEIIRDRDRFARKCETLEAGVLVCVLSRSGCFGETFALCRCIAVRPLAL